MWDQFRRTWEHLGPFGGRLGLFGAIGRSLGGNFWFIWVSFEGILGSFGGNFWLLGASFFDNFSSFMDDGQRIVKIIIKRILLVQRVK